jgi:hypothetical protein
MASFAAEAEQLAATAPANDLALLHWWPHFKVQLAALCHRHNRQHREALAATVDQLALRQNDAYDRSDAGDAGAIDDVLAATRRLQQRRQLDAGITAVSETRQWLHDGEVPGPGLTARLKAQVAARGIAALRAGDGTLVTDGNRCAGVLAQFFAGISGQPQVSVAAQQDVLTALSSSPRIGGAEAAALDSAAIDHHAVHQALRRARSGTSPRPDGLPLELYRRHADFLDPLLARLFSVMLAYSEMPLGFYNGILVVIHKAGDRSLLANYWPITLLNTDDRAFTQVLAGRLGTALSNVIDPQQAAFLPHRSIGDSIITVQAAAAIVAHERRSALAVLCNSRKAYDIVDPQLLDTGALPAGRWALPPAHAGQAADRLQVTSVRQ